MTGTVYHVRVLLRVEDLGIAVRGDDGQAREIVRGVDLHVAAGEMVALIGESGSGKSMTVAGILDLLPPGVTRSRGRVSVADEKAGNVDEETPADQWRGRRVGLVSQDALSALNPVLSLGAHLIETLRVLRRLDRRSARQEAIRLLERVAMPEAERRLSAYAHELSGGQRQRAMIALALAGQPSLLIADEPTTALDVTLQAQILDLLTELRRDLGLAILLITHDLDLAAAYADRALVMYRGEIVESAPIKQLFAAPTHDHTIRLLAARSGHGTADDIPADSELPPTVLSVAGLVKRFPWRRRFGGRRHLFTAVDDVSLAVTEGEVLGIVGESGCGKSTLARLALRLLEPDAGSVHFRGRDVLAFDGGALRRFRRQAQLVFQDASGALDPRMRVGGLIAEPLRIHRRVESAGEADAVARLLAQVELKPALANRHPARLSGGQRQRVAIARALALEPELLVLDEPVSSLDATVQAGILDLLSTLNQQGVTMILISHDVTVVACMAHRIAVMYEGSIVEIGTRDQILGAPRHPYTRTLLDAVPAAATARATP